jgi:hypothetical protein
VKKKGGEGNGAWPKIKKRKVSVAATFILAWEKFAKRPLGLSLLNYHQLPLL